MSPVAFHNFRTIQTSLDLNGPVLSFSEPPEAVTAGLVSGIATFVGVATATFPGNTDATNSGTISYQWYDSVTGALSDGDNVTGSATTTLTLSNLFGSTNNNREFYLEATYNASAYGSVGAAKSTGNAINSPLNSDNAVLTVYPTISFTTQPTSQTAAVDENAEFIGIAALSDDTYGPITQEWTRDGVQLVDQTDPVISGTGATTLVIEQTSVGVSTIQTIAYVDTAGGRISTESTVVDFTGVNPRNRLKVEGFSADNAYAETVLDLDAAAQTINEDTLGTPYSLISFHALEKDMDVKITMSASAGDNSVVYSPTDSNLPLYTAYNGGQGGTTVITTTLEEDVEYTLIGIANRSAIFLYRGSNLILVVGQGGDAGTEGNGGDGGGANVSGAAGEGRQAGPGGVAPTAGTLSLNGVFGSILNSSEITLQIGDTRASVPNSGRTISCSKGTYWIDQGVAACSNNSASGVKFVNVDGTVMDQSDSIIRGFKSGYTISNTAGIGVNLGGNGGNGAVGGTGGVSGSGGGGGAGYTDGSVTIVETNLGGNENVQSSITIELV